MKIIYTLIALCSYCLLNAQKAGILDSSFGVDGIVLTGFSDGSPTIVKGLVQSDNKILAIGAYQVSGVPGNGFMAVRYLPDGLIDSSFGDSGKSYVPFSRAATIQCHDACLQNDGKILMTGYEVIGMFPPVYSGIIIRLNPNGSVDSSFGVNGSIIKANGSANYTALTVQPDNKIIAVGGTTNAGLMQRFLENGSLDLSFGTNGNISISSYDGFHSCKIQPDGKIVVAGVYTGGSDIQFCLKRYLSTGVLDASFGNGGTVVSDVGQDGSSITDFAFQSDGKIVATGLTNNNDIASSFLTARYNTNGSLDNTFGKDGQVSSVFPDTPSVANCIAIQADDRIIVAGNLWLNNFINSNYALQRLTADGLFDSSFGVNGKVITDLGTDGDAIYSMGIQTTGKIVAIGQSGEIDSNLISLSRYNNDDKSKKQIIIKKIKHYIQTHNNAQATTLSNVSIYPNPAQNILHVEGLSTQKIKLTVVDLNGSIKLHAAANASSFNLNIASLYAGNYLLKIETNGAVVTRQFVKE